METVVPAETLGGIFTTKISVTTPTVEFAETSVSNLVDSLLTPILWTFVIPETKVDRPDIAMWSLFENTWDGEIWTETWFWLSLIKIAGSYVVVVVVTSVIAFPSKDFTSAEIEWPLVSVLSKTKESPIL